MKKPLVIDLFAGLGGWAEGFLAENWRVTGFDIEPWPYPGQLVLQDVRTLDGSRFRYADCIVASPPCQSYSYMAMPWKRGKKMASEYRSGDRDLEKLNELFNTCFRIQREASEAAGRKIPLIVENVRGAQPWVGRAKWHYGSYYLWGDVPALMPMVSKRVAFKGGDRNKARADGGHKWNCSFADCFKSAGMNWSNRELKGQDFTRIAARHAAEGLKLPGNNGPRRWEERQIQCLCDAVKNVDGIKNARNWWSDGEGSLSAKTSSHSNARRQASALIAKIPLPLSQHIARVFKNEPHT